MKQSFTISLIKSVMVKEEYQQILLSHKDKMIRVEKALSGIKSLIFNLKKGGFSEEDLINTVVRQYPDMDTTLLYYFLYKLKKNSWLCYNIVSGKIKIATLEPLSEDFEFLQKEMFGRYKLSRFACLHRSGDSMLIESPLGHARFQLYHEHAVTLVTLLIEKYSPEELLKKSSLFDLEVIKELMMFMENAKLIFPCDEEGCIAEDKDNSLRMWEFHDLFFHSRSRIGRHDNTLGGSYSFLGEISPLPGIKPSMSDKKVSLYQPSTEDIRKLEKNFFSISENRRSIRERGSKPITAEQLSMFLYHVNRIQQLMPADPDNDHYYEASLRPYASGGAIHELELYLTIERCEGIEAGFYHYDPLQHELEYLGQINESHKKILMTARQSMTGDFDVLITLAARFQRTSWKYSSIAYSLIIKDVGALYQQMYLVATALGLAPCALGVGNSDDFANASGLDYYSESSVGEFVLSG